MAAAKTPMMKQYHAIRRDLPPNTLLLFRLGDFYEMFFDDAREAAGILNVALTKRGDTPMCGVPFHAAKGYIEKLVTAGKKVAICDQVGEVKPGKLVRRELSQIISAATIDDAALERGRSNFLAAACRAKKGFGYAFADLGTGEFYLTEVNDLAALQDEIVRSSPMELLLTEDLAEQLPDARGVTMVDGYLFDPDQAESLLLEHFRVHSLDGFGCSGMPGGIGAAGATLHYLGRELRRETSHFRKLCTYQTADYVLLDTATQSHLDLVDSRGGRAMSLLGALDRTETPMGARLLRSWILQPLRDVAGIKARQEAVATFLGEPLALGELRTQLREIRDIERAISRLNQGSGNARDMLALAISLEKLPAIRETVLGRFSGLEEIDTLLQTLADAIDPLESLSETLRGAIVEEPPALIRDGGIFRDGYDEALDELRAASRDGKSWIAGLQEREIERTGIKSLKVRYTSVFGYFIEITKANLAAAPEEYIRRQTTVNSERFVTPELKEIESKILGADDKARALESELFEKLRGETLDHLDTIQTTAAALAALDVLATFAETARLFSYCRPTVDDSCTIGIEEGRHPVLDQAVSQERFVPNDTSMDGETKRLLLITGPNMAGKSTYIRQVALLTLLSQTGSFIPAKSARIGVVDRIFTRVGASDDLSRGQSTFMVEMNETANIVNNATADSLIILDEIGRGTSTFDGLSIAWSVAEHLHDQVGARTLFATHYHELTDLERTRTGVRNLNVAVREWNDEIVFLRKIVEGRADQSYGIQVARLAGLPTSVIKRAKEILNNLETSELNAEGKPAFASKRSRKRPPDEPAPQLSLF